MKTKPSSSPAESSVASRKMIFWTSGLGLAAILLVGYFFWRIGEPGSSTGVTIKSPAEINERSGQERLTGRWVRSDGGYIIEIRGASSNGKLDAVYFNPNPIHVGRAEWSKKDNFLVITVELRDTNYPGSTYTLQLHETQDRLLGTYFQAVEGVTYDVEFGREIIR